MAAVMRLTGWNGSECIGFKDLPIIRGHIIVSMGRIDQMCIFSSCCKSECCS